MPKRREGSVAITTENATDWVARAEDLRGEIERLADSTDQRRTLDPEAVELLRDAGLFSIAAPSAVGGAELDPVTQTKVFEAFCAADGSTGWCLLIGSTSIGLLSTYLPDEAIEEVFDGPHFPIAAGSLQPTGRAEREDGGYRVNGRWKFGSGILHSQWVLANTVIHKDGKPETTAEGFPHILRGWRRSGVRPRRSAATWRSWISPASSWSPTRITAGRSWTWASGGCSAGWGRRSRTAPSNAWTSSRGWRRSWVSGRWDGAGGRIRTVDLLFTKQLLYH